MTSLGIIIEKQAQKMASIHRPWTTLLLVRDIQVLDSYCFEDTLNDFFSLKNKQEKKFASEVPVFLGLFLEQHEDTEQKMGHFVCELYHKQMFIHSFYHRYTVNERITFCYITKVY